MSDITLNGMEKAGASAQESAPATKPVTLSQNPKAPIIDLSDLGGIRIAHPSPTKTESPIDLSDIGGKRLDFLEQSQDAAPTQ